MNLQWLVQRNLTNNNDLERIRMACAQSGIHFVAIDIVPFSNALPLFDRSHPSIVYGSTTFNALALVDAGLRKGVFFDEVRFSMENYISKWGRYMLNYEAAVTTLRELATSNIYPSNELLFIRPDGDEKSFAGEVRQYDEIQSWYQSLVSIQEDGLSPDSKIVVSKPYNISKEWRLWIVQQQVIAASRYREYFKLSKEEGCPGTVKEFAEARCREYTPHEVFVMDICLCGDEYFIVECNCMNGAGFYNADVLSIVKGISAYFVTANKG